MVHIGSGTTGSLVRLNVEQYTLFKVNFEVTGYPVPFARSVDDEEDKINVTHLPMTKIIILSTLCHVEYNDNNYGDVGISSNVFNFSYALYKFLTNFTIFNPRIKIKRSTSTEICKTISVYIRTSYAKIVKTLFHNTKEPP